MTAPPGLDPTLSATDARNQSDAASAAWMARKARRQSQAPSSSTKHVMEERPLGITLPRVKRWSTEDRIRQAMAR